jgi:hypothetical protein
MGGSFSLIRLLPHVCPSSVAAQRGHLWAACELTLTARQTTAGRPAAEATGHELMWNLPSRSSQGREHLSNPLRKRVGVVYSIGPRGRAGHARTLVRADEAFSAPLFGLSLRPSRCVFCDQ